MQQRQKCKRTITLHLGENWHHYSVPFGFIGKSVNAIYDTDTVEIYYQHKRIALHKRSYKPHDFTTIKEHMPESHQRYAEQKGWTASLLFRTSRTSWPICSPVYTRGIKGKKIYRTNLQCMSWYPAARKSILCFACRSSLQKSINRTATTATPPSIIFLSTTSTPYSTNSLYYSICQTITNLRGPEAYN